MEIFKLKAIANKIVNSKLKTAKSFYHRVYLAVNGNASQIDSETIDEIISIVETDSKKFVSDLKALKTKIVSKEKKTAEKAA